MKRIVFSLLLLASFSVVAAAQVPSYDDLVSKAKKGDSSVDYKAMRFAFADMTSLEKRTVDPKLHAQMMKLLNEKKFKEVLGITDEIHKTHFVDMNSHIMASLAAQGLKDAKRSKLHESIYVGLVNSILNGGDGNTPKTAYTVITLAEELVVLDAIEMKRGPQVVENVDGQVFHLITATEKSSGQPVKIYFNIEKARSAMMPVPQT